MRTFVDPIDRAPSQRGADASEPERRPAQPRLLAPQWVLGLVAALLVVPGVLVALEPAPADAAAGGAVAEAAGWVVSTLWIGAILGLASRRRGALWLSAGVAGLFLAHVVACPLTGHHAYGLWWVGQLALVGGLLALHATAFRRA